MTSPTVECWVAAQWSDPRNEAKGAMWIWGDLFKLIVGVRWMIGRAILSCDPNKWWRCKVSLNICSLFVAISDAVTDSSLIWGCSIFLACHQQSEADNTAAAVLWGHGNYICNIRILFSHHHLTACIPSSHDSWLLSVNIPHFAWVLWRVCSDLNVWNAIRHVNPSHRSLLLCFKSLLYNNIQGLP